MRKILITLAILIFSINFLQGCSLSKEEVPISEGKGGTFIITQEDGSFKMATYSSEYIEQNNTDTSEWMRFDSMNEAKEYLSENHGQKGGI